MRTPFLPVLLLCAAMQGGVLRAEEPDAAGRAIELLADGHANDAAAMLRRLALAGDADAMERLGIWHRYGTRLLGPGPWQQDEGLHWLRRAADQGSPVARHLVSQRAGGTTAAR